MRGAAVVMPAAPPIFLRKSSQTSPSPPPTAPPFPCAPTRTFNKISYLVMGDDADHQLASARRTKHEMACSYVQNPCSKFVRCSTFQPAFNLGLLFRHVESTSGYKGI